MQYVSNIKPQSAVIEASDGWEKIPLYAREKLIRSQIVNVSHGAFWDWVGKGKFPAPVKLSAGVTAWKRSDLIDWANGTWKAEA